MNTLGIVPFDCAKLVEHSIQGYNVLCGYTIGCFYQRALGKVLVDSQVSALTPNLNLKWSREYIFGVEFGMACKEFEEIPHWHGQVS